MSSITVEEIISKYQTNKTSNRVPTPHSLFITVNGGAIYQLLKQQFGRRPTLLETRTAFSSEWKNISIDDLNLYNEAASRLGYTPKNFNFNREQSTLKARINARLKELQSSNNNNK